ncbi:LysR substrate-binding domain-containing protein [Corallincola platygyrae]|uniref:LysR substrate-binding domain-containing protein n=1 Tax=Corallincola platygyrae TaxID=1193278 RepID=A0ABW4XLY4_9GAMM
MKYTLRQLQVFVAIAEHGTVRSAADNCFITQAAASAALKELEQHLNGALFDRLGKRLQLNAKGEWLVPKAHHLLQEAEALASGVEQLDEMTGVLSIGASQTIAEHCLPDIIRHYHQNYPNVTLKVEVTNSREVMQQVEDGKLNLGLIESECSDSKLNPTPWREDHLEVVTCAEHPLAKAQRPATLGQLAGAQWLLREKGSGTRAIFEQALAKYELSPNVAMTINHPKSLFGLLQSGRYLSCVSRTWIDSMAQPVPLTVITPKELSLSRHFYHVSLSSNQHLPRVQAFIELLMLK